MRYNIDFVICSLVITTVTMGYYFFSPRLNDLQGKMFAALGLVLFAASALDIAAVLLDGLLFDAALYMVNMAFLLCLNGLPCLLLIYILVIVGKRGDLRWRHYVLILLPFAAEFLLLITSPVTGQGFYISNRHYSQGPLAFTAYAAAAVYILASLIVVLCSRKHMTGRRLWAILAFMAIQLPAAAMQYFNHALLLTEFAASISLLIMYISMQPSAEIADPITNAYNISAMTALVSHSYSHREHFLVFGYSVEGLRRINDLYGENRANDFLKFIVKSLGEVYGGKTARVYGGEFCVLTTRFHTPEEAAAAAEKLPAEWPTEKYTVTFESAKVVMDSETFQTPGEMQELLDFALRYAKKASGGAVLVVDSTLRAKYYRRQLVRRAVTDAIREDRVNVFFQPIVTAGEGEVAAAEALARITDMQLGPIPPAEFIPIAEQSGLILDLGRCVRKKVWQLIGDYDIRAAGVDHISVNLSAVECTQKSVMETILAEQERTGAGTGLVHFEITETAAVASEEALEDNMALMLHNGFAFQLDDYGTGYSSMSNLISLPFDVVKIDRSIVTMAEDERRGKLVRRMIAPFHGYGIKVVCEGIETMEQAQMVRSWGTDYIQGYLFSRPLPPEAFIKFAGLKKRNHT